MSRTIISGEDLQQYVNNLSTYTFSYIFFLITPTILKLITQSFKDEHINGLLETSKNMIFVFLIHQ